MRLWKSSFRNAHKNLPKFPTTCLAKSIQGVKMKKSFKDFKSEMITYAERNNKSILSSYKNGNFYVCILSDGTRIKETIDSEAVCFKPDFALNCDVKITNYCDAGCPYCHENSNKHGKHADLNLPIFDTWKAGTEIAIGGGNALAHPKLLEFLRKMKKQKVVCNLTINQQHLIPYKDTIQELLRNELVNGYGLSVVKKFSIEEQKLLQQIQFVTENNLVFHIIAGIFDRSMYTHILENFMYPKILVLGYKDNVGRGIDYKSHFNEKIRQNIDWLKSNINKISQCVRVLSFDNLALAQLDIKNTLRLSEGEWEKRYQGSDYGDVNGKEAPSTFYFDAVNQMIARSSTQPYSERIKYSGQSFVEAFQVSLTNYKKNDGIYGELKV